VNTPAAARIPADHGCIIESNSGALDVGVDVELGIRVDSVVGDDSAEIY